MVQAENALARLLKVVDDGMRRLDGRSPCGPDRNGVQQLHHVDRLEGKRLGGIVALLLGFVSCGTFIVDLR
jgi:hypothetical protein